MQSQSNNSPEVVDFDPFAGPELIATVPSTEPQREIWMATHIGEEASLAYNESISLHFKGSLDAAALRAAFTELVARHESLRSTFSGDGLTLIVSAPFEPDFPFEDWSQVPATEQEQRWQRLLAEGVETPFDLTLGPLFRARLVRFSDSEHRMVFVGHHIVVDGWSTAVIVEDLGALYNAKRGSLGEVPAADSFTDYARALSATDERELKSHEDFWLGSFTGEVPVLELPTDQPRPAFKTFASRRYDVTLSRDLIARVRKAGAKSKASLFATLLGGFFALLHRLTGQEDLVVGIPAAGQSVRGHDKLVGHCVNTLPLRGSVHAKQPFEELLGQVRVLMLDAYEHQEYTFGTLLKKLPLTRDPSRPPLVSVTFNVERAPSNETMQFDGLTTSYFVNPRHFENFELFLNAVELDGEVHIQLQYNTDLFSQETIERWLEAYRLLLEHAADAPQTEVGQLRVMTDAEFSRVVHEWNDATWDDEPARSVPVRFSEAVWDHPDAPAVVYEGGSITYRELDQRSNQMARRLAQLELEPDDRIGLCMERSPELIVVLLGILKAGAAYLPLEPNYPQARMQFMLEDATPKAMVTTRQLASKLPEFSGPVLLWEDEVDALAQQSSEQLSMMTDPERLAYVLYTSGSTGKPKGVEVPHRAIDRLVKHSKFAKFGPETAILQAAPVAFDASTFEIWGALLNGGRLVIHSEQVPTAAGLGRAIREQGVTTMWLTSALFNAAMDENPAELEGLSQLLTGGEALSVPHVRRALEKLPNVELINGYGPTETTTFATTYSIPRPWDERLQAVPIGRPIRQTRLYVLDAERNPVPQGVIGELYIGGRGVARRYLARPELTAERFVDDPFRPGEKLYRTGDLVRFGRDGLLEFFGRADQQVKIRGFRIELGEIEENLLQHPSVQKVAVIMREDRPGDKRLVAYVVPEPGAEPGVDELKEHVKRSLPEYMIPSNVVMLEQMPLTASGKVDRRALPAPKAGASDDEFVAPRSETEALLAELWKEALHVPRISVHDDFFALGGHSLLASQILARLRRDHGIDLSFRKIFEAPTVAKLAELVDGTSVTEREKQAPIPRREPSAEVPLSVVQERHWMLEELQPSQRFVHSVRGTWQLDGELDVGLLQQALDAIAERHEVLRMHVENRGGRLVQVFEPKVDLTIRQIDLRHLPEGERDQASIKEIERLHSEPFDVSVGPLFRATLFRMDDKRHVLFTLRHSMVWDGWSYDIFLKELCAIYAGLKAGQAPTLPELPIGYGDYALWFQDWLKGPQLEKQVAFWREHLAGDTVEMLLPSDHPRPAVMTHVGANERMAFSKEDADGLTRVSRAAGATLYTTLFAAYVALLHRYTAQTEMMIGTPVRGRNRPEVEHLIGNFVNTLVLRVKAAPDQTFSELVRHLRDVTLDAFSNEDMPIEMLGDRPPEIQVLFSFQDARERPRAAGDLTVTQLYRPLPVASNDMMLWTMDYGDHLLAVLNFSTELFEPSTIQRFLRGYASILKYVQQHPDAKLVDLPIAEAEDLDRVASFATPGTPVRADWIGALLESRAKAEPDAVAWSSPEATETFARFDQATNRLARRLAALGAGPGVRVAVALPDPKDYWLALWAALKCRAAVLPLDANAPKRRNASIMTVAAPQLLVTDSRLREELPGQARSVLCLDSEQASVEAESAEPLAPADCDAEMTEAWVRFAVDRDGTPRLVRLSHAALASSVKGLIDGLALDRASLVWLSSPMASEAAMLELLLGPAAGAATVLGDTAHWINELARRSPSAAVAASDQWLHTLDEGWAGRADLSVVLHGAPGEELIARLLPSVASIWRMSAEPELGFAAFLQQLGSPRQANDLGRPVGATRVAVLDASRRAVPIGLVGNVYVSNVGLRLNAGDGVVELDPESRAAGPAVKTSWAGRFNEQGVLQQRGESLDSRVSCDGERFYLEEVERALMAHEAVVDAAAMLYSVAPGDERLVAYFVCKPGANYTETELRGLLRESLPNAMVPRLFVEVPELPKLEDGSVERSRLPSPFSSSAAEYVAPRTETERLLAELWREALKVERVGVYDNFFDLGGHSLLCFKVIAQLEARTGKRINPRLMLLNSLEQVATSFDGSSEQKPSGEPAPASAKDTGVAGRVLKKLGKLGGLLRRT